MISGVDSLPANGGIWAYLGWKGAPADLAAEDYFGRAVAISGQTVIVGAHGHDAAAAEGGAAYIFQFDGAAWNQVAKLLSSEPQEWDGFGAFVDIDGSRVVISGGEEAGVTDSGAAYVFEFDGTSWNETAKLTASDAAPYDWAGALALDGDNVILGAYADDDDGNGSGSAYMFHFDGTNWSQVAKLTASDAAAGDQFGTSVALYGSTAIVGAEYKDETVGSDAGGAYIFEFDGVTWSETAKLTASNAVAFDHFGRDVAIHGDTAVVTAHRYLSAGPGSIYTFRHVSASWLEESEVTGVDTADSDEFGDAIALREGTIIVSSPADDG